MRPTTDHGINIESALDGERQALSLDENSLAHIMGILTDLYSDPMLAVIREYPTNAWDSHVEAGNTAPIEISLPSLFSPVFIVRDFGVGLSREQVRDFYSKYGASSKRESDDVVGMLGLGCKSALTYTDQFTIVAIKDGIKTLATMSRTEDGGGEIEIDDPIPTDEPNGVEVQVPVRRGEWEAFKTKCHKFFQHWKPGTVLVDGKEIQPNIVMQLTDDIYVADIDAYSGGGYYGTTKDYFIMGNVAYPLEERLGFSPNKSICVRVPIGSLNVTPSREALYYKGRTLKTIQNVKDQINDLIVKELDSRLAAATSHADALKIYVEFKKSFALSAVANAEYNGDPIIEKIAFYGVVFDTAMSSYAVKKFTKSGTSSYYSSSASLHLLDEEGQQRYNRFNTIIIHGFEGTDISSYRRKKIKHWISQQGWDKVRYYDYYPRRYVILINDESELDSPWISEIPRVDWDTIDAIKLPRNNSGVAKTSTRGLYSALTADSGSVWTDFPEDEVEGDPIGYVALNAVPADTSFFFELYPDAVIVQMGKNRIPRFLRLYPEALPYEDLLREKMQDSVKGVTAKDKVLYHLPSYEQRFRRLFEGHEAEITSPEVKVWLDETSGTLSPEGELYKKWSHYFNNLGFAVPMPDEFSTYNGTTLSKWLQAVLDKYPMLNLMGGVYTSMNTSIPTQHLIDYVNKV